MVRTRINRLNVRRNRTVVFCPFQTKNHSEWLGFSYNKTYILYKLLSNITTIFKIKN